MSGNFGEVQKGAKGNAPIAASAAQTSDAIDRDGFNYAVVYCRLGAATGTPDSYHVDWKVQEASASDGQYADVAGATLTLDADDETGHIDLDLRGCKRYLKVVGTPDMTGGSTPKALLSSHVVLGAPVTEPQGA